MSLLLTIAAPVALLSPEEAVKLAPPRPPVVYAPPPPPVRTGRAEPASARANLAAYITQDEYPVEAIRLGQEGTTAFRLDVGPNGRVTGCTVTASSGSAVLDATTCRLMRSRPRFTPATDERGQPTTNSVNARIRWTLPPRPVPDLLLARFVIGPDGAPRLCRMEVQHGTVRETREAPACDNPALPAAMIAGLKAQSGRDETRVRHESRLVRDAAAPLPDLAGADGREVLRVVTRFVVEPDGRVSNCQMLDFRSVIGSQPQPCRSIGFVHVQGLAAPTEMRMVTAVVLEGEARKP